MSCRHDTSPLCLCVYEELLRIHNESKRAHQPDERKKRSTSIGNSQSIYDDDVVHQGDSREERETVVPTPTRAGSSP